MNDGFRLRISPVAAIRPALQRELGHRARVRQQSTLSMPFRPLMAAIIQSLEQSVTLIKSNRQLVTADPKVTFAYTE